MRGVNIYNTLTVEVPDRTCERGELVVVKVQLSDRTEERRATVATACVGVRSVCEVAEA